MKSSVSVLLLVFSVLYFGCDSSEPDENVTIQQLFPLNVGNVWALSREEYNADGSVEGRDTLRITIDSAGVLNGRQGFYSTNPDGELFFVYYSGNDMYSYGPSRDRTDLILHLPENFNEDFVTADTTYSGGYHSKSIMKLVSKNAPVTVPAGSFSTFKFESIHLYGQGVLDTSSMSVLHFAPGVGLVFQQGYSYDSTIKTLRTKQELISYVVK